MVATKLSPAFHETVRVIGEASASSRMSSTVGFGFRVSLEGCRKVAGGRSVAQTTGKQNGKDLHSERVPENRGATSSVCRNTLSFGAICVGLTETHRKIQTRALLTGQLRLHVCSSEHGQQQKCRHPNWTITEMIKRNSIFDYLTLDYSPV